MCRMQRGVTYQVMCRVQGCVSLINLFVGCKGGVSLIKLCVGYKGCVTHQVMCMVQGVYHLSSYV